MSKLATVFSLIALLFSLDVATGDASAQDPLGQGRPDVATQQLQELLEGSPLAPKRGVFYEIRSGSNTVYLFGTIHLGKSDFYPMNSAVTRAVASSSRIYLETDISDPAAVSSLTSATQYRDGTTLDKKLSPTLMRRVVTTFERYGVTKQEINSKKPWALANELLMRKAAEMGYDPTFAPDIYLAAIAQLLDKRISGVESIDEQVQVFDGMSEEGQRAYLEDSISSFEDGRLEAMLVASVDAWASGDVGAMEAALKEEQEQEPASLREIRRRLFDDRNVRMAERIESIVRSGAPAFVAVGAAHLVGPDSVIALLRKKGLSIRQL